MHTSVVARGNPVWGIIHHFSDIFIKHFSYRKKLKKNYLFVLILWSVRKISIHLIRSWIKKSSRFGQTYHTNDLQKEHLLLTKSRLMILDWFCMINPALNPYLFKVRYQALKNFLISAGLEIIIHITQKNELIS